ncbi:MAG: sigma-54-dependent Fis family transcriptional regulator [Myxococcales bacterium]|nr:sigma-54-dependent Fis family transcriptional regulator [Myxococcales bacterium]
MSAVLLIEDDDSLREVLAMNLEDFGFTVDQAADGAAGLAAYDPARHGVVVTDIRMPGMDGLTVLDRLSAQDPSAVVVVLTAFGGAERALEAVRRGAFHYVEKPVNIQALVQTLHRAQAHRAGQRIQPGKDAPMVAASPAMNQVLKVVDRVAPADAPVMILGESGVGKELVARAIHARSPRAERPFITVNCAAIPPELLESVLFGHEKGAFTGADRRADGKFTAADGGTLFLDEIGEMAPALQSKLLRVLQDGFVERVGSTRPERVDVRILTATHQDLAARIAQGAFRRDLFYRLHVVPLTVPPLRSRQADIPVLMRHFLRVLKAPPSVRFAPEVDRVFMAHAWPGNVRELRNVVERMLLLREGDVLGLADVPPELHAPADEPGGALPFPLPEGGLDLRALERQVILAALAKHGGNQSATARYLKIPRHVLTYRLDKFNQDPAEGSPDDEE